MMTRIIFLLALASGLTFSNNSHAQDGKKWTVLGSKLVNWRVEKDVLRVGASEGGFTKLKIKVTRGTVNMRRMVVTYGNGTKDEIPLKFTFRKGAESRVIDLRGGKRIIKKITFIYDKRGLGKRAKVWVAGRR